jgi:4-hydroxy-tetrahydrodipicolinate reductase
MNIKVLINGYQGKMGQAAVKAITDAPDLDLVATCGREDDLAHHIASSKAQVVVDLTSPESVYLNTKTIIANHAHPVIGTTGLSGEEINELQALSAAKQLGGIIAPNFSLGAILMMHYAAQAAQHFASAEIIELHHAQKKDAPSGTAIKTAELMQAARHNEQSIPIHSIRLPGLVAHQAVIFGGPGETLTIRHDSIDRSCFMPGILLACRKVIGLKQLIYGLDQLILNT